MATQYSFLILGEVAEPEGGQLSTLNFQLLIKEGWLFESPFFYK